MPVVSTGAAPRRLYQLAVGRSPGEMSPSGERGEVAYIRLECRCRRGPSDQSERSADRRGPVVPGARAARVLCRGVACGRKPGLGPVAGLCVAPDCGVQPGTLVESLVSACRHRWGDDAGESSPVSNARLDETMRRPGLSSCSNWRDEVTPDQSRAPGRRGRERFERRCRRPNAVPSGPVTSTVL